MIIPRGINTVIGKAYSGIRPAKHNNIKPMAQDSKNE
jgi:hypothetical protein